MIASVRGLVLGVFVCVLAITISLYWLYQKGGSRLAEAHNWDKDFFERVVILSSIDGSKQEAFYYLTRVSQPMPLLVSLHSWSNNFREYDALAQMAAVNNWNYIHPDFRGKNNNRDACLSNLVVSDIDDAISFAIESGLVDINNIFVVGTSGGGYAVLGYYLKAHHKIKAFLSWVPVSDLFAWYHQVKKKNLKYANDIIKCTSKGISLNKDAAMARSPLYFNFPEVSNGKLEIYAGINDGHEASVPISHSINFFNRVVREYKMDSYQVPSSKIEKLLNRKVLPLDYRVLNNRAVIYEKHSPKASLVIFDGGHEILPKYCISRIQELIK